MRLLLTMAIELKIKPETLAHAIYDKDMAKKCTIYSGEIALECAKNTKSNNIKNIEETLKKMKGKNE